MKPENKEYLKKRKSVICDCKKAKQIKDRAKFGTCRCDAYSFHYSVGQVLANALYQYLADAKEHIIREDWEVLEKHADAIQEYVDADDFEIVVGDVEKRYQYLKKEKAWREAMHWLTENWQSLWW